MKVFDLLGREVATLVNEVILPGTYRIIWDATEQASGVYYYRIKTGNLVITKKMILAK